MARLIKLYKSKTGLCVIVGQDEGSPELVLTGFETLTVQQIKTAIYELGQDNIRTVLALGVEKANDPIGVEQTILEDKSKEILLEVPVDKTHLGHYEKIETWLSQKENPPQETKTKNSPVPSSPVVETLKKDLTSESVSA